MPRGRTALRARNVRVHGRRTSMKLEPAFWDALEAAAMREGRSINEICSMIDDRAAGYGLTAAIRVFVLAYGWCRRLDDAIATVPVGSLPTADGARD
ncbi:ribbon-helix-helix domain-containing protein [Marivibrio halodurans]|nr:ribbon-helix-helix domain-containing protein [Marivibrio halodurans]